MPTKQTSSTRPLPSHTTDDLLFRLLVLPFEEQVGCIDALDLAIQAAEQRLLIAEQQAAQAELAAAIAAAPITNDQRGVLSRVSDALFATQTAAGQRQLEDQLLATPLTSGQRKLLGRLRQARLCTIEATAGLVA